MLNQTPQIQTQPARRNHAKATIMETIKASQWTNGGDEVLFVKCLSPNGLCRGSREDRMREKHGDIYLFQWPLKVGASIEAPDWDPTAECGGGFHAWPWGLHIGDGKEPDWRNGLWIVYGCPVSDVIDLGGKAKTRTATIRLIAGPGRWQEATDFVLAGQMALVHKNASGAASNSGVSGAASNSGESGAASNSGESGAASNSGVSGAASNSGWRGAASNSGVRGAASNSGVSGAASNSGWSGAASNSGESGAASNSGWSNSGVRGAASNSGVSGAASNSGWSGIAASTGEESTVETESTGLAVSTAHVVTWIAHPGSIFVHRWSGDKGCCKVATFRSLRCVDGERITFRDGEIIARVRP